MRTKTIIEAPSGKLVEVKEFRDKLTIVYQLDDNKNRIVERKANGKDGFLMGLICNKLIS